VSEAHVRAVRIAPHPKGRRLYLFGRRVHHGSFGLSLIVLGARLIAADWRDRPWWPSKEGR